MIPSVKVSGVPTIDSLDYDMLVCALGYEQRCTHVSQKLAESVRAGCAIGFDYHHTGHLKENYGYFESIGFLDWTGDRPPFVDDEEFPCTLYSQLESCQGQSEVPLLALDISSFSVRRIASAVEVICKLYSERQCIVDFYYAIGEGYDTERNEAPIEYAGPVTEFFAGWSSAPEKPVAALFCIGKDYDRAIGAFEMLNPSLAFVFASTGALENLSIKIDRTSGSVDEDLAVKVREANRQLLPLVPTHMKYELDLNRPLDCFRRISSVAASASRFGRPVVVPLGPKLMTLASLISAVELYPDVSVWRVSTGRTGTPEDVRPSGPIVGLRVTFNPRHSVV